MDDLDIKEVEIHGRKYRVREARLGDFLAAKSLPGDEFIIQMLGNMLIDEDGADYGVDKVKAVPLRAFNRLSKIVEEMISPDPAPLDPNASSSTVSPSLSAGPLFESSRED